MLNNRFENHLQTSLDHMAQEIHPSPETFEKIRRLIHPEKKSSHYLMVLANRRNMLIAAFCYILLVAGMLFLLPPGGTSCTAADVLSAKRYTMYISGKFSDQQLYEQLGYKLKYPKALQGQQRAYGLMHTNIGFVEDKTRHRYLENVYEFGFVLNVTPDNWPLNVDATTAYTIDGIIYKWKETPLRIPKKGGGYIQFRNNPVSHSLSWSHGGLCYMLRDRNYDLTLEEALHIAHAINQTE